jgi:hypothetical protein
MYCTNHGRYRCVSCGWNGRTYPWNNGTNSAGRLEVMSDGDLGISLGNGLVLDLDDGDIGIEVAPGFAIDL